MNFSPGGKINKLNPGIDYIQNESANLMSRCSFLFYNHYALVIRNMCLSILYLGQFYVVLEFRPDLKRFMPNFK